MLDLDGVEISGRHYVGFVFARPRSAGLLSASETDPTTATDSATSLGVARSSFSAGGGDPSV
jgi:hypothetical protein